jgi:hypothetical protein
MGKPKYCCGLLRAQKNRNSAVISANNLKFLVHMPLIILLNNCPFVK